MAELARFRPGMLLSILVTLHVIAWTLIPALCHPNAPLDTIESVTWGHEWRWGYEKHPPLAAWVSEAALRLGHGHLWVIFFVSQLAVALSFWAAWQLAGEFLEPLQALLAALVLEGIYYYNYASYELNPNVLQLPLWLCMSVTFWRAVMGNSRLHWILLGICAGISMLAKYYTVFLLAAIATILATTTEGRSQFKKSGIYMGASAAALIVLPHIFWMVGHGFTTVHYAVSRAHDIDKPGLSQLLYPIRFAAAQLLAVLGAITLIACLVDWKNFKVNLPEKGWMRSFRSAFPWVIGLGPFTYTLVIGVIYRLDVHSMWGAPLWGMTGIMLMLLIQPALTERRLRRFMVTWLGLFLLACCVCVVQMLVKVPSRGQFPGAAFGKILSDRWHDRFGRPLEMVGGSLWLGGNVAFYSKDRPSVFVDLDVGKSEWATVEAMALKGGVLVWDASISEGLPDGWESIFPRVELEGVIRCPWRIRKDSSPYALGWAIVPPAGWSEADAIPRQDDPQGQKIRRSRYWGWRGHSSGCEG